ncbi:MAG: NAD(P)/FAD-dependent oxidoreductase [Candidatus Helarchaeota archaeon]
MDEFDVIIVGAGPTGSTTAKEFAKAGLKTLFIEEHIDIGLPQHCSGWLSGSPFTERLVKTLPDYLIRQEVEKWRIWSPEGKMVCEIDDKGIGFAGYFVDRAGFDKHLAKEAVKAGAEIQVGTKFVDLLKNEEIIEGIIVKSRGKIKKIYSKLVIGADGSKSIPMGVALKSELPKLNKKPKEYYPGVQYEFINIKDMTPGIIEIFFGSIFDPVFKMAFVSPLATDNAYIGFGKHKDYENVKKNHPILSKRLEGAQIIRKMGGLYGVPLNVPLKKVSRSGLMLAGDAAGLHGIINGMISAIICAKTGIEAIENQDISESNLINYDKRLKRNSISKVSIGYNMSDFSDDAIEKLLAEQGKKITEFMLNGISKFDI